MTTEPVAAGSPRHSRKNSETSRPTASSAAAAGAAGSFQEKSSNWKRTVSKSSSDWIGNLVFKAQLHEHLVMYKHNMYVDPTAAESGRKGFRSPYDRAAAKNALQINEGKHHRGFLSFASSTLGGIRTSLGGSTAPNLEAAAAAAQVRASSSGRIAEEDKNTVRDWHSNDINKLAEKLLLTSQKADKRMSLASHHSSEDDATTSSARRPLPRLLSRTDAGNKRGGGGGGAEEGGARTRKSFPRISIPNDGQDDDDDDDDENEDHHHHHHNHHDDASSCHLSNNHSGRRRNGRRKRKQQQEEAIGSIDSGDRKDEEEGGRRGDHAAAQDSSKTRVHQGGSAVSSTTENNGLEWCSDPRYSRLSEPRLSHATDVKIGETGHQATGSSNDVSSATSTMRRRRMVENRRSVVFKYGRHLIGKSKRELRLGRLHLYTEKIGGGSKAKHGKIPYTNIKEARLLPKKGDSHFEIAFGGPMLHGSRHYEAHSPEEALALVEKINVLVRQAKATVEILGEDAVSPPAVSKDEGNAAMFSFQ